MLNREVGAGGFEKLLRRLPRLYGSPEGSSRHIWIWGPQAIDHPILVCMSIASLVSTSLTLSLVAPLTAFSKLVIVLCGCYLSIAFRVFLGGQSIA